MCACLTIVQSEVVTVVRTTLNHLLQAESLQLSHLCSYLSSLPFQEAYICSQRRVLDGRHRSTDCPTSPMQPCRGCHHKQGVLCVCPMSRVATLQYVLCECGALSADTLAFRKILRAGSLHTKSLNTYTQKARFVVLPAANHKSPVYTHHLPTIQKKWMV